MADGDVLTKVAGHQAFATPAGGAGGVLAASKALTNLEIKALTTPVAAVAGTAGKYTVPISAQVVVIGGETPFSGSDISVSIANEDIGFGSVAALSMKAGNNDFLGFGGVSFFASDGTPAVPLGWGSELALGAGLVVIADGDFTDGDGTAIVYVQYIVADAT